MTTELSLDDLFKEAKAAMRTETKAKEKKKAEAPAPDPETIGIYRNPANWVRTCGIALIHAGTESLLGNFTEYQHRSDPSARKWIREADVLPVERTEVVQGDWWITPAAIPQPKRAWHEAKLTTLPLRLLSLGVTCPSAAVLACFGEGCLDRVELAEETLFAQPSSDFASLLRLPKGTNIYPDLAPLCAKQILTQLEQPL